MIGAVPALLVVAFAVTALLYASVGFGGGSTYAALLALSGLDHRVLPLLVLACNIVVVAGSTVRFARARILPWSGAVVMTALAAPAALLGGLTPIDRTTFLALLGASLVLTGLAMLLPVTKARPAEPSRAARFMPLIAVPLGYLAGLVGIGGGIFLAPLLHLTRWRAAREIAATASFFILVNSLFGLIGQLLKNGHEAFGGAIAGGLPLLLAVVIGGQAGSLLALKVMPGRWVRGLTALLVMVVGVRLIAGI
ncbi:MAG: sulfite exporter TauE/SafE family protein [Erythrobacter sp.]|uniref:sulfite exporter TauE/SafE family protein n=1 Tax=Erythrobacter sp. TaxID=1042 RepID=UPI0032EC5869